MRFNAIVSAAFCLTLASPGFADERHDPPPLLDTIILWLSVNFDLPLPSKSPTLVGVPPANLIERRYGVGNTAFAGEVIAVYDGGTIYLTQGWTGKNAAELSILVHELVHHLQSAADMRFACPSEREVLAYRAQDAWLGLFGESLESSFGIDPAMIRISTACTH